MISASDITVRFGQKPALHGVDFLARPGEVAAIYMGKKSARFIQGRLLMHGADPATPVTVIENASRPDQRVIPTTLGQLEPTMTDAGLTGPALTFLGLAPRAALAASHTETIREPYETHIADFTRQEAL